MLIQEEMTHPMGRKPRSDPSTITRISAEWLPDVLREDISARGLTQDEAAERAGIPPTTLRSYLRRKNPVVPSGENLVQLGRALNFESERWFKVTVTKFVKQ